MDIICTHQMIWHRGLLCHNYFYLPPEHLVRSQYQALNPASLLDKIVEIQTNEMSLQDQDEVIKNANNRLLEEMRRREMVEWSLLESESNYRNALNALGDQVVVVDRELRIVIANDPFIDYLASYGLKEGLLGRKLTEIVPHLSEEDLKDYEAVFATGRISVKDTMIKINGALDKIQTRKVPILIGGQTNRVMTIIRGRHARINPELVSMAAQNEQGNFSGETDRTEF